MTLSPPQLTYYRLRDQLRAAADTTFDACVHLTAFVEATALFTEIETSTGDTGAALAQRHREVNQILATIKAQSQLLQTESGLFDMAWQAHQAAMANELHPHPVSDDDRIARALAERLEDAESPEDRQALYDLLDDLRIASTGPDWARWGLETRSGRLYWVPFVPIGQQPASAPPTPAEPAELSDDAPPAPAAPAVPAADPAGEDQA